MDNNAEKLAFQINQSGVLCRGYGSLPTAIMTDRFLPIISKGLLCFFYACCGDGDKIALGMDHIQACTGLGRDCFYLRQPLKTLAQMAADMVKCKHDIEEGARWSR